MQMFLTPEEKIIEQLRTENAALKEQITNAKYNYLGAMADCEQYEETITQQAIDIASLKQSEAYWESQYNQISFVLDSTERDKEALEETIAQQAEAIRLKDAALEKIACIGNGDSHGNSIGNCLAIDALAIQPSPEILKARDKRVAEACAKVCIEQSEGIARSTPVSRDRLPTLAENTMFKGIARAAPVRDCSESSVRESAFRIRNGAWERHL